MRKRGARGVRGRKSSLAGQGVSERRREQQHKLHRLEKGEKIAWEEVDVRKTLQQGTQPHTLLGF